MYRGRHELIPSDEHGLVPRRRVEVFNSLQEETISMVADFLASVESFESLEENWVRSQSISA